MSACRMMIKRAVNASDDDVVIFTGSGTTGAIHKLIGVLELGESGANTVSVLKLLRGFGDLSSQQNPVMLANNDHSVNKTFNYADIQ